MRFSEHLGKGTWAFASRALPLVYAIALIMVARSVPREEYGTLVVFQTLFTILFTFSDGFALQAIVKFGVEPNVNIEELVTVTSTLFVSFLAFAVTLLVILREFVASVLKNGSLVELLPWLALFAMLTIPRVVFAKVLQGNFRMKEIFFVDFSNFGVAAILIVVLLVTDRIHSALDVIRITVATGLLSSTIATILVRPYLKFRLRYSRKMLLRISNFVRYQAAMGLASTAQQNFDTLVVSSFTGPAGAAVYGTAKMLFRGFDILRETMTLFVFPAASKYYSRNDLTTLRAILEKSVSLLYLILIPAGIALAFGAPLIFHVLYGAKYDASVPIFRILLIGLLAFPVQMVFGVALSGMGKIKELFRFFVRSLSINMILAIVLVQLIGIAGAAIALVIASMVITTQMFIEIDKQVGVSASGLLTRGFRDALSHVRQRRQSP
jgi:O-antigen/teichoic acid export membrane protein